MGTFGVGFGAGLAKAQEGGGKSSGKRALTDEEHEQEFQDKNNEIQSLQQQMSQVGPNDGSYADLQNRMNQVVADRTALFHPSTPGGLHRLGKLVWGHHEAKDKAAAAASAAPTAMPPMAVPGAMGATPAPIKAAPGPTVAPAHTPTVGELRARAGQELAWGAPAAPQNPHALYRRQLAEALPHMSQEDLDKATEIHAGAAPKPTASKSSWKANGKPYLSDGKGYQRVINNEGQIETREIPADGVQAALAHMSANDHLRHDYAAALGKSESEMTFEDDQNMNKLLAQSKAGTTVGTHTSFQVINGAITPVTVQTTTQKQYGGVALPKQPPAAAAKTPALKRRPESAVADAAPQEDGPAAASSAPPATPAAMKAAAAKRVARPNTGGTQTAGAPAASSAPPAATKSAGRRNGNVRVGDPIGYKDTPAATVAFKARDTAEAAYRDVQQAAKNPSSLSDKGIVLAWLRGRVNRVTASEIQAVSNLGGAELALDNGIARITKGQMSPQQRQWFLDSARDFYENTVAIAAKYPNAGTAPKVTTGTATNVSDDDFLMKVGAK